MLTRKQRDESTKFVAILHESNQIPRICHSISSSCRLNYVIDIQIAKRAYKKTLQKPIASKTASQSMKFTAFFFLVLLLVVAVLEVAIATRPDPCPDGTSYPDSCNTCVCAKDGNDFCTLKNCRWKWE